MSVEVMRHRPVFDPDKFGSKRIDIIGCGATGSYVALTLAKLGLEDLHLWDFDKVEAHNVANQAFGNDDIEKLKVDALGDMIQRQTGVAPTKHPVAFEGQEQLGQVVYILTDSMASRKAIWESSVRYRANVKLMIETRMGPDVARIYAVNPTEPAQVKLWEGSLYGDEVAAVSACGTQISVGPTAVVLSGVAVWTMMQWFKHVDEQGPAPAFELMLGLNPFMAIDTCAVTG
jgi:hypothetical protein